MIKDLSPKASATLARRCLQGMIRDFCGIARATLAEEIRELSKALAIGKAPQGVSLDSVQAIDHVRTIGNIGAHMEKDIDVIVPVDADEAGILIELTEKLIEEWYIERRKRADRFDKIAHIVAEKKVARSASQQTASGDAD
ncbi:DUF4145 domain-containing protein [Prosthecomicrobium sp. N25]|uniref:DUF4145 domain-containing protein n=1 Tax=Prosthecomicrobium sp. N25 TaxID=3129254 RepID=UPI003076A167